MIVGVARVVLHLPSSQSLKDKRQVLKSLIAQVQNQFHIAIAEVDRHDQWQVGVLGLSCVSTAAAHADEVLARAISFIASRRIEADILDYETEIVHAL
ncbi:MAG: DUF503 domain-containing protein [Chloroflexota bacterium]